MFPSFLPAFLIGGGSPRLQPAIVLLLLGLLVPVGSALASPATTADSTLGGDERWGTEFPPPGVSPPMGRIGASLDQVVTWQDHPLIQGSFGFVEGTPAPGLALWNGTEWEGFGEGTGFGYSRLRVLGNRLFALGLVFEASDSDLSPIREWRDGSWVSLGEGPFGDQWTNVWDVALLEGDLVVSGDRGSPAGVGSFEYRTFVSRLTPEGWEHLGGIAFPDSDGVVGLKTVDGVLYAFGDFTIAGGDTARNIARWTGSGWRAMGEGLDGRIYDLVQYHGRIVAAGAFSHSGGRLTPGIAVWQDGDWETPGGGLWNGDEPGGAHSLSVNGDSLLVVGGFTRAGDQPASSLAIWNGTAWHGFREADGSLSHLAPGYAISAEGKWIISGTWHGDSYARYQGLFALEDGRWVRFPTRETRLTYFPSALLGDDMGLLAAGEFLTPDSLGSVDGIGVWNGREWSLLAPVSGPVEAMARWDGRLVVAGAFDEIGGYRAGNIAMLVDGAWTGMGGGTDGPVFTLRSYDGELFAGGNFTRAGGVDAMNIARWNGVTWRSVGSGANATTFEILDLEEYGGDLYACGFFRWMGQDHITAVARWNGTAWSGLGEEGPLVGGEDRDHWAPEAFQMSIWKGRLAVVGRFDTAGGQEARDLALWDGTRWGPAVSPLLRARKIQALGRYLFIGGTVTPPGDEYLGKSYVRAWDGDAWLDLGHGVWTGSPNVFTGPEVTAMAEWGGDLYVGGNFAAAGDHPAGYLACWHADGLGRPPFRTHLLAGPNPATGPVTVSVDLAEPGPGRLRVLDVQGREVARLADGLLPGGERSWTWNLRDGAGRRVAPGVYFLRLDAAKVVASGRLVVLP